MGQPMRRFEDSVVVSIEEVRDLLAKDTRPRPAVPMAVAVPVRPLDVQSMDLMPAPQLAAERAARWSEAPIVSGPVRSRGWRRHRVAALAAAGGLVLGLAVAWVVSGPEVPPEVTARVEAQAAAVAELEAEVETARAEAAEARAAVVMGAAERDELRAAVATLEAGQAAVKPGKRAKRSRKRARRSRRAKRSRRDVAPASRAVSGGARSPASRQVSRGAGSPTSRKAPRKKRKPVKLNKADKSLDALLDGL